MVTSTSSASRTAGVTATGVTCGRTRASRAASSPWNAPCRRNCLSARVVVVRLTLPGERSTGLKVLCLGCHSDDIEIGCGGTLLRLGAEHPQSELHWVVFSATGGRAAEAQRGASLF